jgi:hypothetical protein
MIRSLLLTMSCVLLLSGWAQASPARGVDPAGRALAEVLSGLDPRSLETGLLYDRVVPLARAERFDGSEAAPAAEPATWRQLYDELQRASLGAPPGPTLGVVRERARERVREGVIPLALLDLRYERIRPDALESGALVVQEGRLVAGEGEPFLESRAVAFAALRARTYRGAQVVFALDRERVFTDPDTPLPRIEVDFADGRGHRAVRLGERIAVRYGTPGPRTMRVRLTRADGTVQHAAASFLVAALQTPVPDDTLHITASEPYLGEYGTGEAYLYLAPGRTALANPVIVPEGFDLDNEMDWDELYALLNQEGLAESLRVRGFDAVVLNFSDATDYVQRNAMVVAELIQQVESMIHPQATVAVVGPSMGGLCSRYALAWLETQGPGHRARTWISFDSPHAGAGIPLGVQYWVQFFSGLSADAAYLLERLNTPAARQMLVYHLTDPPGSTGEPDPLRGGLLSDFAAVGGWPVLPRRVSVANGSGSGTDQGFGPGDPIIEYEYSSLLVTLTGNVWAVPDQVSQMIFDGRIRILLSDTQQSVTVSGTRPYDGAPGGWRASMAEMDSSEAPYGDIVALHPNHCFIPIVSSLAVDTEDPFYDVVGDTSLLSHTPFDVVYFPTENEEHVLITPQSAQWFLSELEAGVVGVPGLPSDIADGLALRPAVPNPFRAATRFAFALPASGRMDLRVFGVDGRLVTTIARGPRAAGWHVAAWDGRDGAGRPAPPGLYFVRLEAGEHVRAQRVVKLH